VVIVVLKLNRLGRNKPEYFRAEDELDKLGAEVHSVLEGGKLNPVHAGVAAVLAADESRAIGEQVCINRRTIEDKGWFYGRPGLGYQKRPPTPGDLAAGARPSMNVLEPNPITRGTLAGLFDKIARGESERSASRWLASQPAEKRDGRKFPHATVVKLLQSPTYIARQCYGAGDEIETDNPQNAMAKAKAVLNRPLGHWERLVSDETWLAVQAQVTKYKGGEHAQHPGRGAASRHLLTGLIRCGRPRCGERMHGCTKSPHSRRLEGYRCSGYLKGAGAKVFGCSHYISKLAADNVVIDLVCGLLTRDTKDPKEWLDFLRCWRADEQPITNEARRITELESEIVKSNHQLADALRQLNDGKTDQRSYDALRAEEIAKLDAAELELKQVREQTTRPVHHESPQRVYEQLGPWTALLRSPETPIAAKRALLEKFIISVTIMHYKTRQYYPRITFTPLGRKLFRAPRANQAIAAD
jgi:hypothetical protein